MIDCWFDDEDASDDCSVVSEVSNFELDEDELGSSLHESDEEVSDLENCSSTYEDEPSPSKPQSNSSSFFTEKMIMCDLQIAHHPHRHVLAT